MQSWVTVLINVKVDSGSHVCLGTGCVRSAIGGTRVSRAAPVAGGNISSAEEECQTVGCGGGGGDCFWEVASYVKWGKTTRPHMYDNLGRRLHPSSS